MTLQYQIKIIEDRRNDLKAAIKQILNNLSGMQILIDEPLNNHCTYQIGGPADVMVFPSTRNDLQLLIKKLHDCHIPCFIIGKGSNLLISDSGIRGVVLSLAKCAADIRLDQADNFVAGSGCLLMDVVEFAEHSELAGFENLSGIPGTLGGALMMNAGAFGTEIKDVVLAVEIITEKGEFDWIKTDHIGFGYRTAPGLAGKIITRARLKGRYQQGILKHLALTRQKILALRAQKQPLEYASCGSIFKRPDGNYAGTLIEQAGCKGLQIGGAMVSPKHANFIVNLGTATASDVLNIMFEVRRKVSEKSGIMLEPEVKLVGDFKPVPGL